MENQYTKLKVQICVIYDYYTELLILENNKSFLFIAGEGVSGTVYSEILQYRQGRMKRIINFAKMYGNSAVRGCATGITVNKNKMYKNKCYFRGKVDGKYGWFTYKWKRAMDIENRLFKEVIFAG